MKYTDRGSVDRDLRYSCRSSNRGALSSQSVPWAIRDGSGGEVMRRGQQKRVKRSRLRSTQKLMGTGKRVVDFNLFLVAHV